VLCAAAVVVTVILFVLLARRIARIKATLVSGPRVKAKVLGIGFMKDRGRVEFEYTLEGQHYASGAAIMKNKQTTAISPGDEIEVAIDRADPTRAFVVDLYLA